MHFHVSLQMCTSDITLPLGKVHWWTELFIFSYTSSSEQFQLLLFSHPSSRMLSHSRVNNVSQGWLVNMGRVTGRQIEMGFGVKITLGSINAPVQANLVMSSFICCSYSFPHIHSFSFRASFSIYIYGSVFAYKVSHFLIVRQKHALHSLLFHLNISIKTMKTTQGAERRPLLNCCLGVFSRTVCEIWICLPVICSALTLLGVINV